MARDDSPDAGATAGLGPPALTVGAGVTTGVAAASDCHHDLEIDNGLSSFEELARTLARTAALGDAATDASRDGPRFAAATAARGMPGLAVAVDLPVAVDLWGRLIGCSDRFDRTLAPDPTPAPGARLWDPFEPNGRTPEFSMSPVFVSVANVGTTALRAGSCDTTPRWVRWAGAFPLSDRRAGDKAPKDRLPEGQGGCVVHERVVYEGPSERGDHA